MRRRDFLAASMAAAWGGTRRLSAAAPPQKEGRPLFQISLAQWSMHRAMFAGELEPLEFPAFARRRFGLDAVEYVNVFITGEARDRVFLADLKKRCDDAGVRSLLIMVDREGALGDADGRARRRAVENHHKWVEAARFLGCHSVRVNAASAGTWDEQRDLAADGLRRLAEFADPHGIDVIVENHGGLSSNGEWLSSVIRQVDHPRCGTLPDFGNFQTAPGEWYDRYRGVEQLMPFARAVSAKSHDFDEQGNETATDYRRMMKIVLDAGYRGHVGIEYEGEELSEEQGVQATLDLLERVREQLAG